jgi:hypothetical protein
VLTTNTGGEEWATARFALCWGVATVRSELIAMKLRACLCWLSIIAGACVAGACEGEAARSGSSTGSEQSAGFGDGVAATTASAGELRDEHVICTASSADELRICIDSLGNEGGTVVLKAGDYLLSRHVHVPYSGIHIVGEGVAKTRIRVADHACQAAFAIGPLALDVTGTPLVENVSISELSIDGNKSGNACCERYVEPALAHLYVNGISVFHARGVAIADVSIRNARSGGIVTDRGVLDLTIQNVTIRASAWDGIALYQTQQSSVRHSLLEQNAAAGISLDWYADHNLFSENLIAHNGSGETGLDTRSCSTVVRARASPGIFSAGCSDNVFVNNVVAEGGSNGVQLGLGSDKRTGSARNYFGSNIIRQNAEFGVWVVGDGSRDNFAVGTLDTQNRLGPLLLTDTSTPAAEHYLELGSERE